MLPKLALLDDLGSGVMIEVVGGLILAGLLSALALMWNKMRPSTPDDVSMDVRHLVQKFRDVYGDRNNPNRLRQLNDIVLDFQDLSPTYAPSIKDFIKNDDVGWQIAVIASLQRQPQAQYLTYLRDKVTKTPGHQIGYQAAVALHKAVSPLGKDHRDELKACIQAAMKAAIEKREQGALTQLQLAAQELGA